MINKKDYGFFLIEIMIALTLLVSVFSIIARYTSGILDLYQQASMHTQALSLAHTTLQQIRASKNSTVADTDKKFSVLTTRTSFTNPIIDQKYSWLSKHDLVRVEVSWQEYNKKQTISLVELVGR